MEVFLNKNTEKAENLIIKMKEVIDARKNHHLIIFTCYLAKNLKDIKDFLNEIQKNIRINNITIYIDARQCIKSGIYELQIFQEKFNKNFDYNLLNIYAIDTKPIFHSKAYILQSDDKSSVVMALGSANFSRNGLFAKRDGNFESLIMTSDPTIINNILSLDTLKNMIKELDTLEEYKKESYTFKFSILEQGRFIRKWTGTINQYFSIKYRLTEKGKAQIQGGELSFLGFDVDAETISKQIIKFDDIMPNYQDKFQSLLTNGLETEFGHWIPKSLLDNLFNDDKIHNFHEKIQDCIKKQINLIENEINIYNKLIEEDYIISSIPPIEVIENKLKKLKDNDVRLKRFYHRYSIIELPLDFSSHKEEIKALYDELVEVAIARHKTKKNIASTALLRSIEHLKPSLINSPNDIEA